MTRQSSASYAVALTLVAATAWPQPQDALPRRGAVGIQLGGDDAEAVVATVVPDGSAAADAGMLVGDVLAALDGTPITSTAQVQSIIGRHRAGDALVIDVKRGGEARRLVATLKSFPYETLPSTAFEYGHVTLADRVRLRTIVSRPVPAGAPAPALLVLQGGGCSSIDNPYAGNKGPNAVIYAVALHGFVTMRVDKPGAGESEGPPCAETGFREELAGYEAALRALLSDPGVDRKRVYVLGLSLGGFFAPLLARDARVAGIVTYGTIGFSPSPYPGRSERFFREIAEVDVLAAWAAVDSRVLVLHGAFDDRTTASDNRNIAATVNAAHAGYAEYRELAGLDHCGTKQATPEAGKDNCGGGEETTDLRDTVLEFIGAADDPRASSRLPGSPRAPERSSAVSRAAASRDRARPRQARRPRSRSRG
jgi:dienelactone hydrolase